MDNSQVDRSRANAIVQAMLQPDIQAQEQRRRKRAAEEQRAAVGRKIAWYSLPAMAIGAAVAHFYVYGHNFAHGIIWGGVAGGAIGQLVIWRQRRRSAP